MAKKKISKNKVLEKDISPAYSKTRKFDLNLWLLVILGLIVLIIVCISRANLLDIPLSRDEAAYTYLGKLTLQGYTPYEYHYEMKPPGMFYCYALFGGIFGFTAAGMRIAIGFVSILSAFSIGLITKRFTSITSGIVTAISYLLFSYNMFLFGFASVTEHFVNLFGLTALYFLTHKKNSRTFLIISGGLFAMSVLVKQSGAIFLITGFFWYLFEYGFKQKLPIRELVLKLVWLSFGGLGLLSVFLVQMIITGSFDEFIYWVFEYPSTYITTVSWESGKLYLEKFVSNIVQFQFYLFTIAGLGFVSSFYFLRKKKGLVLFSWLLLVLGILSTIPGLRFYGQYWILCLPAAAILVGSFYYFLEDVLKKTHYLIIASVLFAFSIFMELYRNSKLYYFTDNHEFIAASAFSGNPFSEHKWIAEWLEKEMRPSDEIMVLGSEPQYYIYLDKMAPSKHFYHSILTKPITGNEERQKEALRDLEKANPDYVVGNFYSFAWSFRENSSQYLYQNSYSYLNRNYTPVAVMEIRKGQRPQFIIGESALSYDSKGRDHIIVFKSNSY